MLKMEVGKLCAAVLAIVLTLDKGHAFVIQPITSPIVIDNDNGNNTYRCIFKRDEPCPDDEQWRNCANKLTEEHPGCSLYTYFSVASVDHNCSSTETSCDFYATINKATKTKHDLEWECSSYYIKAM